MNSKRNLSLIALFPLLAASSFAADKPVELTAELIRSDYAAGEVTRLCEAAIHKAKGRYDAVAAVAPAARNIENTLLALETTGADFSDEIAPLTFMSSVSTNEGVSKEGSACSEKTGEFNVAQGSRKDLYQAIVGVHARNGDEARLLSETIKAYELNGLKLPDDQLAKITELKTKLSALEVEFAKNLNEDKTFVTFTAAELEGVPESALARFKKQADGQYIVTTKSTDYISVIENAKNPETRRRIALAYQQRGTENNVKLLEQAVALRAQIAKLLGYANWGDYKTDSKMAKTSRAVMEFLDGLRVKLASRNKADLDHLLAYKKEIDPSAKTIDAWDTSYLANQLQKRDYNLDQEKVREYFPSELVIDGMFKIYSKMLGVRFEEIKNAKVWAPDVHSYAVYDAKGKQPIAFFYTDFYPRPGKYGHAAAFPLRGGRRLSDGSYLPPVASIVSNFTAPSDGKPSLMTHDEVSTAFHEFGHIMHMTLTKAPYSSLSGASVKWDFVEAPSQMLENWVWSPQVLNLVSGHYLDHSKKLPKDLQKQMLAARDFNQGLAYTRQLFLATFDMTIHTQNGAVDALATYDRLYREIAGLEPIQGGRSPGTIGHFMGGYDAGYYGYLWSEVYAQDMFSKFNQKDLTSNVVGGRYRKAVLSQGAMKEPVDLLRDFLGREPRNDAFFKRLGIK